MTSLRIPLKVNNELKRGLNSLNQMNASNSLNDHMSDEKKRKRDFEPFESNKMAKLL